MQFVCLKMLIVPFDYVYPARTSNNYYLFMLYVYIGRNSLEKIKKNVEKTTERITRIKLYK